MSGQMKIQFALVDEFVDEVTAKLATKFPRMNVHRTPTDDGWTLIVVEPRTMAEAEAFIAFAEAEQLEQAEDMMTDEMKLFVKLAKKGGLQ